MAVRYGGLGPRRRIKAWGLCATARYELNLVASRASNRRVRPPSALRLVREEEASCPSFMSAVPCGAAPRLGILRGLSVWILEHWPSATLRSSVKAPQPREMNGTGNLGGVTVSGTTCELLAWLPWLASGTAAWKLGLGQFLEIERPPPSDAIPSCFQFQDSIKTDEEGGKKEKEEEKKGEGPAGETRAARHHASARVRPVNSTEKAIQGNYFHVAVSDMRGGQNNFGTFVLPDIRSTWES
ncbi:hypothetical protein B0T13DRAFT_500220 [Neurospora crassa]|nr:hypothetical protein B0T13DRAFT_500220 [Neurospora crassa]